MTMGEMRERLLLHGRILWRDGAMGLSWSFSGCSFCFEGDALTIACAPYPTEEYLAVIVDGITYKMRVCDRFSLALKNGSHTVSLRRASADSWSETVFVTAITVNGVFTAPPAEKKRKLEFIGDSITCGYGVLGAPGEPYHTRTEDATLTYAARMARMLDAEARLLSISGQGVVHECTGEVGRTFSTFFDCNTRIPAEGAWDFADGWQPDAVIINAGTNDVGGRTNDGEMTAGAIAFVRKVRARYPDAVILWTYGLMNGEFVPALTQAVETVRKTDEKVWFLPLDCIYDRVGEVGANGHPGLLAHRRAANAITAFLQEHFAT